MRKLYTAILLFVMLPGILPAQGKYTLSGFVRDAASGEDLVGVNIYLQDDLQTGTQTNFYGFYSLTLPAGDYNIVFAYIGFDSKEVSIPLDKDIRMIVQMDAKGELLDEIVVTAEKKDANISEAQMSTQELSIEEIKSLPAFMGEVDILKTIQLFPGVQSAGEGNTGLYVRGGGPDQNLILLDEAVVYNPGHLFGFFSVFNPDVVRNTKLVKGGMAAEYGGRLSSVIDVGMREGNNQRFEASGGIGLISSKLTLEGPIVKDKSSFIMSGRRTYADILVQPFIKGTEFEGNRYFFYDLNTKVNYRFSDKDRLYLSGYFGRDKFLFNSPSGFFNIDIPWGNATGTLRWNHLFSDKVFMNTAVIYNDYNFETRGSQGDFQFRFYSGIRDVNVKSDIDYYISAKTNAKFGVNYTYHTFTPLSLSLQSDDDDIDLTTDRVSDKFAHEAGVYAQLDTDLGSRLKVNAGLRFSGFQQVGPYTYYKQDQQGDIIDTIEYGKLEKVKSFAGLEPRLNLRYLLSEESSLKASVTLNNQYIHLVSNSTSTLPTDIWVPSSMLVEPQKAWQYAIGYFRNFAENTYETSIEVYYKDLLNQIEYRDGYSPGLNEETEQSFVFGKGKSYGLELFFKKRLGKLNGWIGYTLSKTTRQFDDINRGNEYPAKYDRRHDLSVVAAYEPNKRWNFSAVFVFGTGDAFTVPVSWYLIEGNIIAEYGERNSYRMNDYHRLDLAATLHGKEHKNFSSSWVFSVYNVYSRLNPYFIYFETEGNATTGSVEMKAKQVSIFPIIPSVTWNFKIK